MAIKGSGLKIQISTDATDSTYNDVNGMNSVDLDPSYEAVDVTQFGDTGKRQLPTMATFSGSASGVRDTSDTGQTAVVTAATTGVLRWVKVLPDGTNGWKCCCLIKMKQSAKVTDAVQFSFDFEAAGGSAAASV
jgi:predicted secreted protein